MIERNGIEYDECVECGAEFPSDMLDDCMNCFEGPLCPDCLDGHEADHNAVKCVECKQEVEEDPPCPICKANLCDNCFPSHLKECQRKEDFEKHQLPLTLFITA